MAQWVTGYNVCEEHGTIRETVTREGVECSVQLRCAWADRFGVVTELLATPRVWPYFSNVYANSATISPFPERVLTTDQSLDWLESLITVNYSSFDAVDIVAESLEPTAEFITLDYKRFRWGSVDGDPLLEGEAPGKLRRSLNLVRQYFKVAPPLNGLLLSGIGFVHNASYASALLGLTFEADTLLFNPPTLSRTITTGGSKAWNVTTKWSYKPETWNKYWRTASEDYEEIYNVDTEAVYNSYPSTDLSDLLS